MIVVCLLLLFELSVEKNVVAGKEDSKMLFFFFFENKGDQTRGRLFCAHDPPDLRTIHRL